MILDGKATAKKIRESVKQRTDVLKDKGVQPKLVVILASDDAASAVYVRNKEIACKKAGIISETYHMPPETTQVELIGLIKKLNADKSVHGILLQLPVYRHLDPTEAIDTIDSRKDVDGFTPVNTGMFYTGQKAFAPCTPKGCMYLLKEYGIELAGKRAVVIGRSNIVGKPLAMMLTNANCTVTLCHSRTAGLADITREADIVAVAVGKPGVLTGDMIKEGAAIIDVGINRMSDGTLSGDADWESCSEKAGWITPVPGGVGPMTIAMLIENTVEAAELYGLDAECNTAE